MDTISVVVPCFNEEDALPHFYKAICKVMESMPKQQLELVLVNDGSKDNTLKIMQTIVKDDARVKYISFSRNFGKEAAMMAGFEHASGEFVAVMDADMQDPPELLLEMYNTLQEGEYDCVATRRTTRKGEPRLRSFFAKLFYKLINKLSKTEIVDGARDFRLMTRQMLDAILAMPEYHRFSKGMFSWVGFNTKWLEYVNVERVAGETKWSFWKLLLYSIDGIVAFSTAPLAISSIMGFVFCIIAFIMIIVIIVKTIVWGDPATGWPSMMCVIFLVGGVQLFSIGVLGQYLAKAYTEVKKRPIYVIKESNFTKKDIDA